MANLSYAERMELEDALGMGGGYVGSFSNSTFADFIAESVGVQIYDEKYSYEGGSKAKLLRAFWKIESSHLVAKLLVAMHENWTYIKPPNAGDEPPRILRSVAERLRRDSPVSEIEEALSRPEESDFDAYVDAVRQSIEVGRPAMGLDRLHTYMVQLLRHLCTRRGVSYTIDTPLHSLAGGYIKALDNMGKLESEMTKRILKSSISILDAFNAVRNERTLAHANEIINDAEAELIVSHVADTVRFMMTVEANITDR